MKLTTTKLKIGYKNKSVLNDINLDLSSGDFVVLIGKNGSGKSTLLKTLSSILPKISGKILIDEQNFDKLSGEQKTKLISIVLTERIDTPLTVKEILHLGRQAFSNRFDKLSENDLAIINKIIEELNLETFLHKPIQELSDGEKQKVMIAKVLVQQSPIILLDEPTTHLDIENKAIILNLLKKISHKQKKIIVISTHDINLVLPIANKIWVIDKKLIINLDNKKPHQLEKLFDNKLISYDKNCNSFKLNF